MIDTDVSSWDELDVSECAFLPRRPSGFQGTANNDEGHFLSSRKHLTYISAVQDPSSGGDFVEERYGRIRKSTVFFFRLSFLFVYFFVLAPGASFFFVDRPSSLFIHQCRSLCDLKGLRPPSKKKRRR